MPGREKILGRKEVVRIIGGMSRRRSYKRKPDQALYF
jgi:hypothetical protein